jgi:hypothetical protein
VEWKSEDKTGKVIVRLSERGEIVVNTPMHWEGVLAMLFDKSG